VLIGTLAVSREGRRQSGGRRRRVFSGIKAGIKTDRPTFLLDFLHNFYNYDVLGGKLVSERVVEDNWNVAAAASATVPWPASMPGSRTSARTSRAMMYRPHLARRRGSDSAADATSRRQAKMIKTSSSSS